MDIVEQFIKLSDKDKSLIFRELTEADKRHKQTLTTEQNDISFIVRELTQINETLDKYNQRMYDNFPDGGRCFYDECINYMSRLKESYGELFDIANERIEFIESKKGILK